MPTNILTYAQAVAEIQQKSAAGTLTFADIEDMVSRVSVVDPTAGSAATTIEYSGDVVDGIHSGAVGEALKNSNPSGYRTLNENNQGTVSNQWSRTPHHFALRDEVNSSLIAYRSLNV